MSRLVYREDAATLSLLGGLPGMALHEVAQWIRENGQYSPLAWRVTPGFLPLGYMPMGDKDAQTLRCMRKAEVRALRHRAR